MIVVYQLIHASSAAQDLSDADIEQIVLTSVSNNLATGITGLLIYLDGSFLQVLEGEKELVDAPYRQLYFDHRHTGILKVFESEVEQREFSTWSMGLEIPVRNFASEGLFQFTEEALTGRFNPAEGSVLKKLLQTFVSVNSTTALLYA